jgi:hypothetical protein
MFGRLKTTWSELPMMAEAERETARLREVLDSPHHRRMLLEESGINPQIVLNRGYRTVKTKAELKELGFSEFQRLAPALLVPMYSPTGELVTYQVRPDVPREDTGGKLVKYETPYGSEIHLDVHPSQIERMKDPSSPLWITEGVKKGDCLVSNGQCTVVLQGVWCWQRDGTYLQEWEQITLHDRLVYVVFDSDVMTNFKVQKALGELAEFLRLRGAITKIVYLPGREDGKKQGVDDFLAAGGTVEELKALATEEFRDTRDTRDTDLQEEWQMRELPKAPAFPIDALPTACRKLALEAATALCCPVEFVAVPMLAALGSAIGNSRSIQLKEGWEELAVIYCAVVSGPGTKKTPPFKEAMAPVYRAQERLRKQYEEKKADHEEEMREYEAEKMRAKQEKVAPSPPPEPPIMESTFVSDTTVEALTSNLGNSPRGLGLFRDELTGLVRSLDQYKAGGRGSDRQFYLEAWSPGTMRVDRKGSKEPLILHRPFLCISGSIQPQILPELGAGREDGFLDRFLLSYPDPMCSRWSDAVIPSGTKVAYRELYEGLRALEPGEDEETGQSEPRPVGLTLEARELIKDKMNALREEMEALGFSEQLAGPWAKLEAYLGRLALIVALSRSTTTEQAERVEREDVLAAAELVNYFQDMAKKVYVGLYGTSKEDQRARDLGKFLEQRGGYWKGNATRLHGLLGSPLWPERPDDLAKAVVSIGQRSPTLSAERKKSGSNRHLILSLKNGVPGVPGVPTNPEHPKRDPGLDELAELVRNQEAPW